MKHRLMVPIVLCLCLTLGACGLSAEGPVPLTQAEIDRANDAFAAQGEAWLQQGREYWGVPGLEPGGDYAVESGFTVQRYDNLLSLRYERREQLAGEPAVTVSGALYDLETGSALTLEDLFQVPVEEFRPALLDLLEEASGPDGSGRTYDAETFTTDGFYLTETDLVLLFPVWEGEAVSPTATLERPISLEALRDLPRLWQCVRNKAESLEKQGFRLCSSAGVWG